VPKYTNATLNIQR